MRAPRAESALRVGGLVPLSTTDYPGELAAVIFCQGCPWRCGYCHNPHLLETKAQRQIAWADVVRLLASRAGLLDAVVFSGGEPLAQRGLAGAMRAVRALGFRIGLHTGGAYPDRLGEVLPLVDWVGFDVKTGFADYAAITRAAGSGERALASLRLLLASGVAYEVRTTVHPARHRADEIVALAQRLAALGTTHYVLQAFRAKTCLDPAWACDPTASFLTSDFCARIAPGFASFEVRHG
jgi:pyruvate formate lyase activating enzyme